MTRRFSSINAALTAAGNGKTVPDPIQSLPRSLRLGSLTGCLTLFVYLLTIAPDITWSNFSSDGGELIAASVTLGIAHPPGYPTYIILGKLFSLLPFGTVAFRYNVLSALAMSFAAAFTTITASEVLPSVKTVWSAAVAAGLALAFSPVVWSQATVAEVYALNLALLSIFLWSLLTQHSSLLIGIFLGLAITTHLTSLLMLPLAFALVPDRQKRLLAIGILIGLFPLLALPFLDQLGSPVIWGDPSTLKGWWWLTSARLYSANLYFPEMTQELLSDISRWSTIILRQFAWAGWLFVIIGVFASPLGKRRTGWLIASAGLYAVFSIVYNTDDSILNLLPALLLLAPLLAVGLSHLKQWALLLPILLLVLNFQSQNLSHEQRLRPMTESLALAIPENAIVVTPGDQSIFSLWYFHHVEEWRPDLILVDSNLLAFEWYRERLADRYPILTGLSTDNRKQFQEMNSRFRPYCELSLLAPQEISCHKSSPGELVPEG